MHVNAAIGAEKNLYAGIARNFSYAGTQPVPYFFSLPLRECPAVGPQLHQYFLFPLFHCGSGMGISAADVFRVQGLLPGKPGVRGFKVSQTVAHPVLAPLMLGIQGFELAQVGSELYLGKDERVAGSSRLHFRGGCRFALHVIDDPLENVPFPELLD